MGWAIQASTDDSHNGDGSALNMVGQHGLVANSDADFAPMRVATEV